MTVSDYIVNLAERRAEAVASVIRTLTDASMELQILCYGARPREAVMLEDAVASLQDAIEVLSGDREE